jgi:hypothetical protein
MLGGVPMMQVRPKTPANSNALPGPKPTAAQLGWLKRGLTQPGGKLPLFDENGRRVNSRTITACIEAGWAEPWFANPIKPDWEVCKLTADGHKVARAGR